MNVAITLPPYCVVRGLYTSDIKYVRRRLGVTDITHHLRLIYVILKDNYVDLKSCFYIQEEYR